MVTGLFALIALLALAGAIAVLSSRQPPQNQETNNNPGTEESQKEEGQSLLDVSPKESNEDALVRYNLLLTIFTGVLAFVALVQIGFLVHASRTATTSAKAAKEAADATRESVELAQSTAERQLRAYILIEDVLFRFIENESAIDYTMVLRNSGQTPGYNLRTRVNVRIGEPPAPYTDLEPGNSASIIAPNASVNMGPRRINLAPETPADLRSGKQKIYIWGRADYTDAFGNDRYFTFQGTNGDEIVNTDAATGRVNWRGFPMQPTPDGEKAN